MKRFFLPLLLLCSLSAIRAQAAADPRAQLVQYEDSLKRFEQELFKGKDVDKAAANRRFAALLEKALATEGSFQFPFDSLDFISRLKPDDGSFRIITWNIPKEDGTHEYFGFVQTWDPKTKQSKQFKLYNKGRENRNPEILKLGPEKWYGALYYKIVQKTFRKKKYYTLLGWDGNTNVSWKKVIDVISFRTDGTPEFGDDIFQVGKRYQHRVIFEFKAEMTMALRWDDELKMIVFDFLAPEYAGMSNPPPQFLISSGRYDGYAFKKGKWNYVADVNARSPKSKNDSKYVTPH